MNAEIPHLRILASAGSGKTYQLTNRYLRLLLAGVPPERIIALTFTRKAAGEFFDAILTKLAEACTRPEAAARLARQLEVPENGMDWHAALARVLRQIGKLHLGTLDGFFHEILSTHSVEFGIGPRFNLMEESEAFLRRQQLFRDFFKRGGIPPESRRQFAEAFKEATFGNEQRSLLTKLERFIQEQHEVFLLEPDPGSWGNPSRIWAEGEAPGQAAAGLDRADAARRLLSVLDSQLPEGKAMEGWRKFLEETRAWEPGMDLKSSLLEKILAAREALEDGYAEIVFYRTPAVFEGDAARLLLRLVDSLLHRELQACLRRTRGIREVIDAYERFYERLIRRQGNLTFTDIQLLLAGIGAPAAWRLSQGADGFDDPLRLDIHFRLDGRFDHWLLDEFQDTSRLQWGILRNLVDEVVMDPGGQRTFFFVGDVKQAIYGWRGGDAGLFDEISRHYGALAPSPIRDARLAESWRSGPAIIELVNAVFGREEVLRKVFSRTPEVAQRWAAVWDPHVSARADLPAYAAYRKLEDADKRFDAVAGLLDEIRPGERGLSAALLVRKNDEVRTWVRELRSRSTVPVVEEREVSVGADNAPGRLLVALVQAATHPADTFSWEFLLMTPLGEAFRELGPAGLTRDFQLRLAAGGYHSVFEFWIRKLFDRIEPDAFTRARSDQLLKAAEQFDRGPAGDPESFLVFLEGYTVRPGGGTSGVRVMTVHQAKGLGFDLVLLPDFGFKSGHYLDKPREGLAVGRDRDGSPPWILSLPKSLFTESEPKLARQKRGSMEASAFESICLFYVALTRAKQGLYLFTDGQFSGGDTPRYEKWLAAALPLEEKPDRSAAWERGDPRWFEGHMGQPAAVEAVKVSTYGGVAALPERITPSRAGRAPRAARISDRLNMERGSWVHRAFEQVGWLDPGWEDALETWVEEQSAPDREAARIGVERVRAALRVPRIRDCFLRPESGELFREQAFDLPVGDRRIAGQWDRLWVDPGVRAVLIDFKGGDPSGAVPTEDDARDHYGEQLELYREAVSRGFGLSGDAVSTSILYYNFPEPVILRLKPPVR